MLGFYNYTVLPTYLGFASGLFGILLVLIGQPDKAIFCLMLAGVFDAFDGKIARMNRNRSNDEKKFGIQIDSLSDLVCFGVLPAVIGMSVGIKPFPFGLILILYVLAALIRLAYFNVMEDRPENEQERRPYYEGLPVTSTALLFPLLYIFKNLLGERFKYAWAVMMLLIAILFIVRFRIRKPNLLATLIMIGVGFIEFCLLLVVL